MQNSAHAFHPRPGIRSRLTRSLGVATFAMALSALMPIEAGSQALSEEALQEAMRRTGMSREEILSRHAAAAADGTEETVTPPGLTAPPGTPAASLPPIVISLPGVSSSSSPSGATPPPTPAAPAAPTPSGSKPVLFGSSFFRAQPGVFGQSTFGPVPEDYRVGVGDEIVVDVWGDVEFRLERFVDRDGSIILPKGGKILCAGRTMSELKRAVRERLSASYSGISLDPDQGTTFLDVSLGRIRAIRVFVIGDAAQPGAYELSSVSTIFTALHAAGGPSSSGSMRDIQLVRGDQLVARLDVYEYLLTGNRAQDATLREHDTILIPPRGRTVALAGAVRRPFLFEMKEGENLSDLLRFGGGFEANAATEVLHIERILPPRERRPGYPDKAIIDVALDPATGEPLDRDQATLRDGDRIDVDDIGDRTDNWVEIAGPVKRPGRYQFVEGMHLDALIERAGQTWPELLEQRVLIDRTLADGSYEALSFPLGDVLAGRSASVPLASRDRVRIFSRWDIEDRFQVTISGDVRQPGSYEFRTAITLRDLVLRAGGLLEGADPLTAQVSRLRRADLQSRDESQPPERTVDVLEVPLGADFLELEDSFLLEPHDHVSIRRLPWWETQQTVTISGEVMYPGVYSLQRPDETLSEIIERARGLKPTAFVPGARITRARDDIGNIPVDLKCALHKPGSVCDLLLAPGDEILIPPEPRTVRVAGAVGHPTSILYRQGRKPSYYIERAGGYSERADKWKTQVVYPNGLSRRIRRVWADPIVEAGSVIVVPAITQERRDRMENMEKIASIFASVATAYIVIDRLVD